MLCVCMCVGACNDAGCKVQVFVARRGCKCVHCATGACMWSYAEMRVHMYKHADGMHVQESPQTNKFENN